MSDEFNTDNRTFTDGHDPVWTALDKPDDDSSSAGGGSQQFYNSTYVTTEDGYLNIKTEIGKTQWTRYDHVNKEWKTERAYFKSGMVQSWEKFCFTGGIVEVDVILPGDPYIGGLWPAVWMLGNLGRATYESSTNNIWPWSFDTCDRKLQPAQAISACNAQNHYGLNPYQGRGATEIDIIEIMTGFSDGPLPSTKPPISLPYADMTLQVCFLIWLPDEVNVQQLASKFSSSHTLFPQVAPGVPTNRPQSGSLPVRKPKVNPTGHTEFLAQTWYNGLEMHGNTSINPFFYGTYLGVTKPGEPVTRGAKQAFQADAVGVAHQLTPSHFNRTHTFRLEWQPGPGGRIDWFSKGHRINATFSMMGDGLGHDWVHAYGLQDDVLKNLMGSQIPNEPTYLIMNTAVSSTWGFPYDTPTWCKKCYDCDDPKCSCTFAPGFCEMLRKGDVAMKIDSIRVYQSNNPDAHVGNNHTLGCDPPEYPTKGWIEGHSYRYMRNAPFSYEDTWGHLRNVLRGGGSCKTDSDCGGDIKNLNLTELAGLSEEERQTRMLKAADDEEARGRGKCVELKDIKAFFAGGSGKACECFKGYTGPRCMAQHHTDTSPSAWDIERSKSPFKRIPNFEMSPFLGLILVLLTIQLIAIISYAVSRKNKVLTHEGRPVFLSSEKERFVSGNSI